MHISSGRHREGADGRPDVSVSRHHSGLQNDHHRGVNASKMTQTNLGGARAWGETVRRWEVPTRAVQGVEGDPRAALRAGSLGRRGSGEGLTHSSPSEAQGQAPVGCSGLGVWGHKSQSETRTPSPRAETSRKGNPQTSPL